MKMWELLGSKASKASQELRGVLRGSSGLLGPPGAFRGSQGLSGGLSCLLILFLFFSPHDSPSGVRQVDEKQEKG